MDDDGNFHLTIINKESGNGQTFIDKSYSVAVDKAFRQMKKELKWKFQSDTMQ